MAVAEILETRAYFRTRDKRSPDSPQPQKCQSLPTPILEDNSPETLDITPPEPLFQPTPAHLVMDPITSNAAHEALSNPWAGPADFRYGDDDTFEDSNDINDEVAQPVPITGPAESESSDTGSETDASGDDSNDLGSSDFDMEEVPDIFETNADLNAAEYSE
jgi:hypothetical protein